MLELAIKAKLPLVAVITTDRYHFDAVVEHLTSKVPVKYKSAGAAKSDTIYYGIHTGHTDDVPADLRKQMEQLGSTYIGVNFKRTPPSFFDAGTVPVPKKMVARKLAEAIGEAPTFDKVLAALGGLTLKEVDEVLRLTMARDGKVDVPSVLRMRKDIAPTTKGLSRVEALVPGYVPPAVLVDWVQRERHYFLKGTDPRLIPRGLMFDGPAGVGKSEGAKFIAEQFGVPLYRISLGGTKHKYVGDSEGNLEAALSRVDQEEPCVLLWDEIEKMIAGAGTENTGVTDSMLSHILWWAQEHRSRVLSIMTTNNKSRLPPELYRPGRINRVFTFTGLSTEAAVIKFAQHVMQQLPPQMHISPSALRQGVLDLVGGKGSTQAAVTDAVYETVKQSLKPVETDHAKV